MANPEHVEIVKRGPAAIAEWHTEHPDSQMDLSGAHLTRANLRRADLGLADLSGASLGYANLSLARLPAADLDNVRLRGALLRGAEFRLTELASADLRETDLFFANFSGANLDGAQLDGARLYETTFGDVDLRTVQGLESLIHDGPSIIDERTLRESWPLPDVFLRGVGLSDETIDFYRATLGRAVEFYSCFISYSSSDEEFAQRLHADLQAQGVRCWFAPHDLKIGDPMRAVFDKEIRLHDKLLLILSEHSVGSQWVEQEVETALEKERKAQERGEERPVLFPVRLDDAVMENDGGWPALVRNTRHIGDFTRWKEHDAYQQSFERLLRDLKAGATPEK